jgi:chemotaxis protein CheC
MLGSANRAEQPGNRKEHYPDVPPIESNTATLPIKTLASANLSAWTWLVEKGISNALSGLSQMVGKELGVTSIDLKWTPASKVIDILGIPDNNVVGIYLTIEGDATGHMLLLHDTETALHLVDMQFGLPKGSTQELDEMGYSILGETGNITGSFFLNALADTTNLVLMPSPPSVLSDAAGAVLNVPLTSIMAEYKNVFVTRTTFQATEDNDINGTFIVLTAMDFMTTLLDHTDK